MSGSFPMTCQLLSINALFSVSEICMKPWLRCCVVTDSMSSSTNVRMLCWWYAGEEQIHWKDSRTQLSQEAKNSGVRFGAEGGRVVNHIMSSKREKCLRNRSWKPRDSHSSVFLQHTVSPSYLFQDGFPLRRLVSKTTQEELSQLDCEVGEEGEVSYNIGGNALWNKYI